MGKIKFVDNAGNFTAKGYVLNEVYETGPRTESGKNPGKFYYHVTGKNIVAAGLNEWETNLFLYFKFPSNSEEANQANAYLAVLKGTPVVTTTPISVSTAIPASVVSNLPPLQTVVQQSPTIVPPSISDSTDVSGYLPPKDTSYEVVNGITRDILLAGLLQSDFNSLNICILKAGGKPTLTITMDTLPPLAINSGDISATSIVEQIVSTFSESAQIVSTIREWRKGLSELQAELAKENVDTKAKVDAKAKRVAKAKEVPIVETAIPNELPSVERPVTEEPVEPGSEETLEPVFMDDSLDMPPVKQDEEPDVQVEEGNGLDEDVDEFQLK